MKIKRFRANKEQDIITGMIVDDTVLARIASHYEKDMFHSEWANIVSDWCVKYQNKYDKAPGKQIQHIFESWASRQDEDSDEVVLIERYLKGLSQSYAKKKKEINPEFVIDRAAEFFNEVRLKKFTERLEGDIDTGQIESGWKRIEEMRRVEIGQGAGIHVFRDEQAVKQAFTESFESIIKYPAALGEFFEEQLARDSFVAFMAPEKRGKTFFLMDMALMAAEQGHKTVFFAAGDMSQSQMIRRIGCYVNQWPINKKKLKGIKFPTYIEHEPDHPFASVDHEERNYKKELSWQQCYKAFKSLPDNLIMSCHPNSTLSVNGIKSLLQIWEQQDNWSPDVIIIDYADILAPNKVGAEESRTTINSTWKGLRALSQLRHCLVVTATQTNAASYYEETLDRGNFSEDKRKYSHVTAMYGINQTESEKEDGLFRLNPIVVRESDYMESKCVHVAGCLALGRPHILSSF